MSKVYTCYIKSQNNIQNCENTNYSLCLPVVITVDEVLDTTVRVRVAPNEKLFRITIYF